MIDEIQKHILEEVADLHSVPEGAYNIRANGQMADRIMVIEDGKIASIGATDEILPQLLGKTADSYSCLTCR